MYLTNRQINKAWEGVDCRHGLSRYDIARAIIAAYIAATFAPYEEPEKPLTEAETDQLFKSADEHLMAGATTYEWFALGVLSAELSHGIREEGL